MSGAPALYLTTAPAAPAAGGPTTVDLSAGTLLDPNSLLSGSSSRGTNSALICNATHGHIDGGLDSCVILVQTSARPSTSRVLHVKLSVSTLPTEDPGSGGAPLECIVTPSNSLSSLQGYHGGLCQDPAPVLKFRAVDRVGNGGSNGDTLAGAPAVADLFVVFNQAGSGAVVANLDAWGDTSGDGDGIMSTDSAGTWTTTPWVGVSMGQIGASPSSVVTWGGVVVTYQWL